MDEVVNMSMVVKSADMLVLVAPQIYRPFVKYDKMERQSCKSQ